MNERPESCFDGVKQIGLAIAVKIERQEVAAPEGGRQGLTGIRLTDESCAGGQFSGITSAFTRIARL